MGGFAAPVIKDATKEIGEDLAVKFSTAMREGLPGFYRSLEGFLGKTEEGKVFSEYLKNKFEPYAHAKGQELFENFSKGGMAPDQAGRLAVREAFKDARKQFLGKKDEVLVKFLAMAHKKYGRVYADNVADGMSVVMHDSQMYNLRGKGVKKALGFIPKPEYRSPKGWELSLRSAMSWAFTPFIAIPHTTQVGNLLLDAPIKMVADGFHEAFGKLTRDQFLRQVLKSGALFDEVRYQMADDAAGGGLVRKIFHQPGFGWVRRNEIIWAAATGKHAALDAAERFGRDQTDRGAWVTLKKLGLDPADILKQEGKLTEQNILTAMYREADRTIFIRSGLQTPWKWEESAVARIATMYKHFGFRQGRFMIDSFRNSANSSVGDFMRWVAVASVGFPMMGELVHSVENLVRGKSPLDRPTNEAMFHNEYIDAVAHAAGFGILYSMVRSAQHNGMSGWMAGPVISTVGDILGDIATGNMKGLLRHSVRNIPLVGSALSQAVPHGKQSKANPYIRHTRGTRKSKNFSL